MRSITVTVEHEANGGWSVALPGNRVNRETLDDGRRIAHRCAAHTRPCELLVHYACHRVIRHELIDAHQIPPTGSPGRAPRNRDVTSQHG